MNIDRKTRAIRAGAGVATMVIGSTVVIGALLMINRLAEGPNQRVIDKQTSFQVEKKAEPPPKKIVKRQQPEPQRRATRTPPMVNLDTSLSGVDVGIPGLDAGNFSNLQDSLLGDTQDVVMTDDSVDSPPQPTYRAPMQYPKNARAQGKEGYVVLSLLISATGEIEQVEVLESSAGADFEQAARQGIRQWRFKPAQYQGRNVKVWARQRIRFNLS
ncbi:MAG: TonB family protein [Candidatus Wenzhouxiangella sp. M2_3B_020]